MSTKRVTSDIGLNIPASQYTNVESMAHEILIVPSNTTPLWNTQVNVDIREKIVYFIIIMFQPLQELPMHTILLLGFGFITLI